MRLGDIGVEITDGSLETREYRSTLFTSFAGESKISEHTPTVTCDNNVAGGDIPMENFWVTGVKVAQRSRDIYGRLQPVSPVECVGVLDEEVTSRGQLEHQKPNLQR